MALSKRKLAADYTFWDFVLPIRRGDRRVLDFKRGLFLLLQFGTAFVVWIFIFTNFKSRCLGESYSCAGLDELLAILSWLVISYTYWLIYDRVYQR